MNHGISYTCSGCQSRFQTSRTLSIHQAKSLYCDNYIAPLQRPNNIHNLKNSNTEKNKNRALTIAKNNSINESDTESQNHITNEIDDTSSIKVVNLSPTVHFIFLPI